MCKKFTLFCTIINWICFGVLSNTIAEEILRVLSMTGIFRMLRHEPNYSLYLNNRERVITDIFRE